MKTANCIPHIFIILVSIVSFFLCSCKNEVDYSIYFGPDESLKQEVFQTYGDDEIDLENLYQYANMQHDSTTNFMRYKDGALFLEDFVLYYLDFSTMEVRLFCNNPACAHGITCDSRKVFWGLERYKGDIYGCSRDGTTVILTDRGFETAAFGSVGHIFHAEDGRMFATTFNNSLVVYDKDLSSCKELIPEYLIWEDIVLGDYIYGFDAYRYEAVRVNISEESAEIEPIVDCSWMMIDETGMYFWSETLELYHCTLEGLEKKKISDHKINYASFTYDDEYLYFAYADDEYERGETYFAEGPSSHEFFRVKKEDAFEPESIARFDDNIFIREAYIVPGYDYVIVSVKIKDLGEEQYGYYAVKKDGSQMIKLDIPKM